MPNSTIAKFLVDILSDAPALYADVQGIVTELSKSEDGLTKLKDIVVTLEKLVSDIGTAISNA